jgi:hypothetical protein
MQSNLKLKTLVNIKLELIYNFKYDVWGKVGKNNNSKACNTG